MIGHQFVSYPITALYPSSPLPGDIYLFVGGRFVKLYHQNDEISVAKYDSLIIKKVQFLFILRNDMDAYKLWSQQHKAKNFSITSSDLKSGEEQVPAIISEIRDEYLTFLTSATEDMEVRVILEQTKKLAQTILTRRSVADLLSKMMSIGQTFVDHSTNVANISIYIGASLGYTHQVILENLFLGGLFHDYGKVKIDAALRDHPESEEYRQALLSHPSIGKAALHDETRLGDEVLDIVAQHHEKYDGTGYPLGLKGGRIYELTKIVSIANFFDHQMMEHKGDLRERQVAALDNLATNDDGSFDPKILTKVIKCMRLIIKN